MPSNTIEVILKSKDEATPGIKKMGQALAALGVAAVAKQALGAAIELGTLGAQAERTERGFTTISGGAGAAAANLDAMMTATNGAIDRTTAMGLANQMMQMGLADSAESLGKNAEMATRLGAAMGVDAMTAMQNWNAMMANQSLPRLDTYGISSGKVRIKIEELMKATEGLTREQAFSIAVMDEGAAAMERLGPAMDDNALSIEQNAAALADLKTEIGIGLADAVGGSSSIIGKFTRQWGDNLRILRDNRDEVGLLRGNLGMLGDALGLKNTVFDQLREAEDINLHAVASGATALAQGFSDVGTNAPPAAQGIADVGDAAVIAEQGIANAASAALDFASGIDSISTASFAKAAIDSLGESILAAGGSTMQAVEAQRALLTELGLLTSAKEAAAGAITTWGKLLADRKIDVDMYALAVANLKSNIDALEGKDIEIKTIFTEEHRAVGQPGPRAIPQAAGGDYYVNQATSFVAGEAGPERAIFIPRGQPGYDADWGALLAPMGAAAGTPMPSGGDSGTRIGTVNLTVNGTSDARETARLVMREFQDRGFIPRMPLR